MPCLKAKMILECKIVSLVLSGLARSQENQCSQGSAEEWCGECLSRFEIISASSFEQVLACTYCGDLSDMNFLA